MAELTTKGRKALPDSAFAIVRSVDGKKERKYPVHDEAHQRNALSRSHAHATPAEHQAVHRAVGSRNKALLASHMKERHGAGRLKRALDGLVALLTPPPPDPEEEIARMARGGTVAPSGERYPHAKWTIMRPGQKAVGPFEDRRAAMAHLVRLVQQDPNAIKDATVVQAYRADQLLADAMSEASYR